MKHKYKTLTVVVASFICINANAKPNKVHMCDSILIHTQITKFHEWENSHQAKVLKKAACSSSLHKKIRNKSGGGHYKAIGSSYNSEKVDEWREAECSASDSGMSADTAHEILYSSSNNKSIEAWQSCVSSSHRKNNFKPLKCDFTEINYDDGIATVTFSLQSHIGGLNDLEYELNNLEPFGKYNTSIADSQEFTQRFQILDTSKPATIDVLGITGLEGIEARCNDIAPGKINDIPYQQNEDNFDFCEHLRFDANRKGYISNKIYAMLKKVNFVPSINPRNDDIYYLPCSQARNAK